MTKLISGAIAIAVLAAVASLGVSAQQNQMSFSSRAPDPATGQISVDSPGLISTVKRSQRPPERAIARGARI